MTDLKLLLPPVRDQGERETCLSIALTDGHHAVRGTDPSLAVDFLHFSATVLAGVGINDAIPLPSAMLALEDTGQPDETECPYSLILRPKAWTPPAPQGPVWRHRTAVQRLDMWNAIEARLDAHEAVVLVITVDDAFFNPTNGVVNAAVGPPRASHAVLALALASDRSRVLVRNSWGNQWGDGGYSWLSSAYVTVRCVAVITFQGAIS